MQRTSRRERSVGTESCERERSARDTERSADASNWCCRKIMWADESLHSRWQWTQHKPALTVTKTHLPGWLELPNHSISIKTRRCTVLICSDFFSICWGSGFNTGSRTVFHTDQYGRWRRRKAALFYQPFNDLGSNDMPMGFFSPPHSLPREIYTLCCGFMQDMCVCAMRKVRWAHAGNMQAFVGIFLFFPGSASDFSGIRLVVKLPWNLRYNSSHIAAVLNIILWNAKLSWKWRICCLFQHFQPMFMDLRFCLTALALRSGVWFLSAERSLNIMLAIQQKHLIVLHFL